MAQVNVALPEMYAFPATPAMIMVIMSIMILMHSSGVSVGGALMQGGGGGGSSLTH